MSPRSSAERAPDNVAVLDHPIVRAEMTRLRDRRTTSEEFRQSLRRISGFIAAESLRTLSTRGVPVRTPLAQTRGTAIADDVVFVPVLRAGLGFLEGFLDMCPSATVAHVGLYRDEKTLEPVEYYVNVPKRVGRGLVVVLDPMLATGGSATATLSLLRRRKARRLTLATLIAAPEGIRRVQEEFPDVRIVTCAVDKRLNNKGFIVPGLGDAGDRLFGT